MRSLWIAASVDDLLILNKKALKVLKPLTEIITNFCGKCLKSFEDLKTLSQRLSLREKCPNTDQKTSIFEQFSRRLLYY